MMNRIEDELGLMVERGEKEERRGEEEEQR